MSQRTSEPLAGMTSVEREFVRHFGLDVADKQAVDSTADGPRPKPRNIQPVKANGPDSLRNGVALSSTFHWMFDRGLISIDDDYSLLFKRNAIPGSVESLVNGDRRLRLPDQRIYHPHPRFLEYHPERVFKG